IEAKLKPLGIQMTHIVAPGLAHQFPPEWQKKAEQEYSKHSAKGREEHPRRIHFVTYTLKYHECDWVEILGLDRHYERTLIDAEWKGDDVCTVKPANIRALSLRLPPGALRQAYRVSIDGQNVEARPYFGNRGQTLHVALERRDGKWSSVLPERLLTERLRRP